MRLSLRNSRRDKVVLPAPEGDDKTNISPRLFMRSFQVLHLLAELLDDGFELKPDIGEFDVVRLGAQGIRFAVEFLGQEIEPAADRAAVSHELPSLRDMGGEPVEFFANVGLAGEQDGFLMQ